MKNLFIALTVLVLSSCSKSSRTVSGPFPNYLTANVEWITYEGILLPENGQDVLATLHLAPGTPGIDAYYRLEESLNVTGPSGLHSMGARSQENYTVLFGSPGHHIIQITSRGSIMRGKEFGRKDHVTRDLYMKSNGDHGLVVVDENFQVINERYKLIRRSDPFTAEGYFTVYHDTTDYFERNTRKQWPVAQLACYDEVVSKYHVLAKEKFEGVYLKALSYTVRHTDVKGRERVVLVFRKVLHMGDTDI